jgi:hypothetical protein
MMKCDEINDPDSCFNKARATEIIFVILERDAAAPATIRKWVSERIELGLNQPGDKKLTTALEVADRIERHHAAK